MNWSALYKQWRTEVIQKLHHLTQPFRNDPMVMFCFVQNKLQEYKDIYAFCYALTPYRLCDARFSVSLSRYQPRLVVPRFSIISLID